MISIKENFRSIRLWLPKSALVIFAFLFSLALPIKFAQAFNLFTLAGLSATFFYGVIAELLGIIANTILGGILWFVGWIFDIALKLSTQKADIVNYGWEVSLKFANMFFIIILLAIAIGTILNLQKVNKSLLPQFFMVALLINFSMVIGGIIIDATNVFALFFSDQISKAGFSISAGLMGALGANIAASIGTASATQLVDTTANFVNILILSFYQIIIQLSAIFILAAGAVYMILRTFHLWTLLMISPLAWIAMIIPGQKKHWDTWWDQFIKWSLFAPVFLFFTYLALIIASKVNQIFTNPTDPTADFSSLAQEIAGKSLLNPVNIIQLVAVVFLMFFGIVAGQKMGVAGSNFVLSYGKNLKSAASKKFKDMRGKSEWSAENIGKKFGALGARVTAPFGVTESGKRIQERYELERLETKEKKEKQRDNLAIARKMLGNLKNKPKTIQRDLDSLYIQARDLEDAEKTATPIEKTDIRAKRAGVLAEIKKLQEEYSKAIADYEVKRLNALRDIRKAAGEEKDLKKEIEKLAKEAGVIEEKEEKSSEGKKGEEKK